MTKPVSLLFECQNGGRGKGCRFLVIKIPTIVMRVSSQPEFNSLSRLGGKGQQGHRAWHHILLLVKQNTSWRTVVKVQTQSFKMWPCQNFRAGIRWVLYGSAEEQISREMRYRNSQSDTGCVEIEAPEIEMSALFTFSLFFLLRNRGPHTELRAGHWCVLRERLALRGICLVDLGGSWVSGGGF